jgi:hypothetical protein
MSLRSLRTGVCVGGPLDGEVRSVNRTCETLEAVVHRAHAGVPSVERVRYLWRDGQWVLEGYSPRRA